MYSTVTTSNVSAPKEMKNVQTQTSDFTVQTVSQTKPESSGRKAQKPTEKPKVNTCTTPSSAPPAGRGVEFAGCRPAEW